MRARYLVVPQWQGSGSSRAMRLLDGAEAIRGDLPERSTTVVEVPTSAGERLGTGVDRFSALDAVRQRMRLELAAGDERPVVVIGGDCGVELAAVEHALTRAPRLALVWIDAHADLHTADTSPSHAFHGMVLRALLGDGPAELTLEQPVTPDRVVLAGARALEPEEAAFVTDHGIAHLSADDLDDMDRIADAVAATGADAVYLHIDLDVLDPVEVAGLAFPEPFGVTTARLAAAVRAVATRFPVVGAGITEFAPASVDDAQQDMATVLRILSAATSGLRD